MVRYISDSLQSTLDDRHLRTMWDVHEDWNEPDTALDAYLWRWEEIQDSLRKIEQEAPLEDLEAGLRRSLALTNPAEEKTIPTPTISVFFQTVTPGEEAAAHRHNVGAFRFVVEGSQDMYTVVEGEPFPMEPGDLITTPNWTYHDHVNQSDQDTAVWIDVLDWPFVGEALNAPIFENHQEYRQPMDKPQGFHNSQFGRLRPLDEDGSGYRDVPPYRFAWDDAYESLQHAMDNDVAGTYSPYDGVCLEYVDPETGQGPTMATMSLRLQLLESNDETDEHRHNSSEVFHVVRGSGSTRVGDQVLEWGERDTFVVPSGNWHAHAADEEAVLFAMSDQPIFDAFELYHEETRS